MTDGFWTSTPDTYAGLGTGRYGARPKLNVRNGNNFSTGRLWPIVRTQLPIQKPLFAQK